MWRIADWFRQTWCGFFGHREKLELIGDWLYCDRCGDPIKRARRPLVPTYYFQEGPYYPRVDHQGPVRPPKKRS